MVTWVVKKAKRNKKMLYNSGWKYILHRPSGLPRHKETVDSHHNNIAIYKA